MNLKSRTVVTLSWTLVSAIILGLASCDETPSRTSEELTNNSSIRSSSDSSSSSKTDQRTARKYLELDDLNAYESPVASEVLALNEDKRQKHGKKFTYREKRQTSQLSKQQQQQRARTARQKQQQKQRPGFLWTIARVTYESFNDTKSAISQIREIISNNIEPEQPKRKPTTKRPSVTAGTASTNKTSGAITLSTTTTEQPETSSEAEFKLTVPVLQSLVRRNVKGLVRLFNIELKDAMSESAKSAKEFRRELGKQVGMYLQDNPDKY